MGVTRRAFSTQGWLRKFRIFFVLPEKWRKQLNTQNQACRQNDTAQPFTKILVNLPQSMQELRNKNSDFVIIVLSHTKLLTSIAYLLKQVIDAQNIATFVMVAPFSPSVCMSCGFSQLQFCEVLTCLHFEGTKGHGSDMPIAHAQFTCEACALLVFAMVGFKVLIESLSLPHLVADDYQEEFVPTCSCSDLPCLFYHVFVASFS